MTCEDEGELEGINRAPKLKAHTLKITLKVHLLPISVNIGVGTVRSFE